MEVPTVQKYAVNLLVCARLAVLLGCTYDPTQPSESGDLKFYDFSDNDTDEFADSDEPFSSILDRLNEKDKRIELEKKDIQTNRRNRRKN